MPPSPKVSAGSRLAAVALGLGAGLLLGELLLRVARPAALERGMDDLEPLVAPHPEFGWTGRPNLRTEVRFEPEFRHAAVTNSRGLRSVEMPYAKGARPRVLCLGDSLTFGLGVESAEAFCSLVGAGLSGTEVVNGGVVGWGTAQEFLWLEAEGLRYGPDVLVLGFFVNDFWENEGGNLRRRRPVFAIEGGALVLASRPSPELALKDDPGFVGPPEKKGVAAIGRWLRLHSRLARAAALGAEWVGLALPGAPDATPLERASLKEKRDRRVPPAQEVTQALLARIRDLCVVRGIRLVALLIPSHEDVAPGLQETSAGRDARAAYDLALSFCRTLGIDTVDLRPKLRDLEGSGTPAFYRGDLHMNAAGHRAAADLLLERLGTVGSLRR